MKNAGKLLVLASLVILSLSTVESAFGFGIHNLDYENSPYEDKTMPSLEKPVQLFYEVVNNTPKSQGYNVTISITNLDDGVPVYFDQRHYGLQPDKYADIIWNYAPVKSGLYQVEVIENSNKTSKYVFAVPENDEQRILAKKDPASIRDKSPRQQFRMGIDPKEIQCKVDFYLALKPSSLPVCVSLDTLQEFRKRDFVVDDHIDFGKIGYFLSETQFKKMLAEKNIKYTPDNFLLITGMMLPMGIPVIDYCGYVLANNNNDYWFSSSYHDYDLTSFAIHGKNPNPCMVGTDSCGCNLQIKLEEKNLKELSYFDLTQEAQVGKIFQAYLNEGYKVVNVPNLFVVGKYNHGVGPDVTSFCGQFKGKYHEWYFLGYIKDSKVAFWSLELENKPKLCAINKDSTIYQFKITKTE